MNIEAAIQQIKIVSQYRPDGLLASVTLGDVLAILTALSLPLKETK